MADRKALVAGVIGSAITPRRAGEHSIDLAASLELLDFLFEGGVSGVALLGSTGEFPHFMLEDRARMLDFAVKRSRLPILVNVSHSTLDGAIYLAEEAVASGVAALLLAPPYYYRYSQSAVSAFCLKFAERLANEVPVYLYNIPAFSNEIQLDTARALLDSGLFAGIKDSSGTWPYLEGLLADHRLQVFSGDDRLFFQARTAGSDGGVSGVACAFPELVVALDHAIASGARAKATGLNTYLQEICERARRFPAPAAIREACKRRGIAAGAHATPLGEATERELAEFGEWFQGWFRDVLTHARP